MSGCAWLRWHFLPSGRCWAWLGPHLRPQLQLTLLGSSSSNERRRRSRCNTAHSRQPKRRRRSDGSPRVRSRPRGQGPLARGADIGYRGGRCRRFEGSNRCRREWWWVQAEAADGGGGGGGRRHVAKSRRCHRRPGARSRSSSCEGGCRRPISGGDGLVVDPPAVACNTRGHRCGGPGAVRDGWGGRQRREKAGSPCSSPRRGPPPNPTGCHHRTGGDGGTPAPRGGAASIAAPVGQVPHSGE